MNSDAIQVRPFEIKDFDLGKKLYLETFKEGGFSPNIDIDDLFHQDKMIVAENCKGLIGLCTFLNYSDNESMKTKLETTIGYSTRHEDKDYLLDYYTQFASQLGKGTPIVEFFKNEMVGNITLSDNDGVITAIALVESEKGKGLGKMLLRVTETALKNTGSEKVFIDCWDRGNNRSFYESQGYLPIIRLGPQYADGSALVVMGKMLT